MQHITYAQAVKEAETFLGDHGIADAPIDAWLLFSYVTGISRAMFLAERMRQMPEVQYQHYQELLKKRASHIPLQHLTGEQEFMGFSFLVNLIWILFFGWEMAIGYAVLGLVWCVTILGIPVGKQCFKMAKLALMPFGAEVVG